MTAEALLINLHQLGIRLRANGNRLQFAPASAMTPELITRLTQHKAELLALLTAPPEPPSDFSTTVFPIAWEDCLEPHPCRECGGLDRHQDVTGRWHCSRCTPPKGEYARRMAERLRAKARRRVRRAKP